MLDSSFALELVLPTHASWQAEVLTLFDRATAGDVELMIPMIFFAEVAQVLTRRVRGSRNHLPRDEAETFIAGLERVPMALDVSVNPTAVLYAHAQQFGCGVYDAMYVELAQRMALPIATRDRGMATAARAARVDLLTA